MELGILSFFYHDVAFFGPKKDKLKKEWEKFSKPELDKIRDEYSKKLQEHIDFIPRYLSWWHSAKKSEQLESDVRFELNRKRDLMLFSKSHQLITEFLEKKGGLPVSASENITIYEIYA